MSCQESHCIQLIPNLNSFHTAQVSSKAEPRPSVSQSWISTISHLPQYKVPTLSLAPTLDSNCVSNLLSFNFTTCSSAEGNFLHTTFLSHPSLSSGNLCALAPQSWWLFLAFIPNEEYIIPKGKNISFPMGRIYYGIKKTCVLVWVLNQLPMWLRTRYIIAPEKSNRKNTCLGLMRGSNEKIQMRALGKLPSDIKM